MEAKHETDDAGVTDNASGSSATVTVVTRGVPTSRGPSSRMRRVARAARPHHRPKRSDGALGRDDPTPAGDQRTKRGNLAEERAVAMLQRLGYRVIDRNYRCHVGELDIVAYDDAVLVFIEVRSRADDSHGHAAEMVTKPKQRKVSRVAACYIEHMRPIASSMRFDVVAITGDDIELVKDAWRLGRYG